VGHCISDVQLTHPYCIPYNREIIDGFAKEYLALKTMGGTVSSLPFISLADMPPIPKAFPREECESVTLFFKSEY